MPEVAAKRSPATRSKLIVTRLLEGAGDTSREPDTASKRVNFRSRRDSKEHGRALSSEWIDVDESPSRKRRSGRRSSRRHVRSSRPVAGSELATRTESKPSRFFPRLSQILEGNESVVSSRDSTTPSDRRRHRDRSSHRRSRYRTEPGSIHRSSAKNSFEAPSKKTVKFFKANPSLLSVLSTVTAGSDRSSRSGSTVTQQSYNKQAGRHFREPSNRSRQRSSPLSSTMSQEPESATPSVFDYMETSEVDDGQDGHSIVSSRSSSHYEPSDAESSHAPDTPSSRSTFPSPTTSRSQTVPELSKNFDSHQANVTRSSSNSPASSLRSLHKRPSVSDVAEEEETGAVSPSTAGTPSARPPSRPTLSTRRRSVQLHQQEESLRQHMKYSQQSHYIDTMYGQRRSFSNSSVYSDRSGYGYHLAMQQYQWPPHHPAGAPPTPPHASNGQTSPHGLLSAPQPPDLSTRTLTGYEELAVELSTVESPVKPLYRKFEYLNHRILLHLQDELCELEEQLRAMDEMIAQMDPVLADGQKTPSSRRNDAFRGSELHHRRTQLLGNIFMKTEQYNRAMSSYASIAKDAVTAEDDQVASYQEWMNKHSPVHEVESRFLLHNQDLIVPGKRQPALDRPTKHAALAYLPVALMLPLLLYSIIPTLAGRLAVTALIAIGAFIVAAMTRIR